MSQVTGIDLQVMLKSNIAIYEMSDIRMLRKSDLSKTPTGKLHPHPRVHSINSVV